MPLVVENGTGKVNANSYVTVAQYDTYCADRGRGDLLAMSLTDKHADLVVATSYVDSRWGKLLKGIQEFPTVQALLFPRTGIVTKNGVALTGIPVVLMMAVLEYAVQNRDVGLFPTIEEQRLPEISEIQVGPIKINKEYRSTASGFKTFQLADSYMNQLVNSHSPSTIR